MSLDRLKDMIHRGREFVSEARDHTLVRAVVYGVIVFLGFAAVVNLVVGIVAGLQGEWIAAVGLILVGGGLVLVCELLVDFLSDARGSGSISSR